MHKKTLISVYWVSLDKIKSDLISKYEGLLCDTDRQRYLKMTDKTRRLQFLLGRILVLKKCGQSPQLLENGKPVVDRGHISISHSGDVVALAVSEKPVGLDVEKKVVRTDYAKIAERLHFSLTENKMESFYQGFTRFESVYKLGMTQSVFVDYREEGDYLFCIANTCPDGRIDLISEDVNHL